MHELVTTRRFKRDLKKILKRGYDMKPLDYIVELLVKGTELPARNKDHALTGKMKEYRECHIAPDWLLVYKIDSNNFILTLTRTGTHSDLFR